MSLSRTATAAACTAEPTLAVVEEPPDTPAGGRSVSPNSHRTISTGRPSTSAATCVNTV